MEEYVSYDVFNNILFAIKYNFKKRERINLTNNMIGDALGYSPSLFSEYSNNTRKVRYEIIESLVLSFRHCKFILDEAKVFDLNDQFKLVFKYFFIAKFQAAYNIAKEIITDITFFYSDFCGHYLILLAFVKFYENDTSFIEISDEYYLDKLAFPDSLRLLYVSLKAYYINIEHNTSYNSRYMMPSISIKIDRLNADDYVNTAFYGLMRNFIERRSEMALNLYPSKVFLDYGFLNFYFLCQCNELFVSIIKMDFNLTERYLQVLYNFKNQISWKTGKNIYFWLLHFSKILINQLIKEKLIFNINLDYLFNDEEYKKYMNEYVLKNESIDDFETNVKYLSFLLGVDNAKGLIDNVNNISLDSILNDNKIILGCKILLLRIKYLKEEREEMKIEIRNTVNGIIKLRFMETKL